jgi:hypothetical protein
MQTVCNYHKEYCFLFFCESFGHNAAVQTENVDQKIMQWRVIAKQHVKL